MLVIHLHCQTLPERISPDTQEGRPPSPERRARRELRWVTRHFFTVPSLCHVLKAACYFRGHILGGQAPWEEGCSPGRLWELGSLPKTRPGGRRGCLLPWVINPQLFPNSSGEQLSCTIMLWLTGPPCRLKKPMFHSQGEVLPSHIIREQLPSSCTEVVLKITLISSGTGEGAPGRL